MLQLDGTPDKIRLGANAMLAVSLATARAAAASQGVRFLLARAKVLVEPSGAAGIAALLHRRLDDVPGTVATVLTGGNADFEVMARILRKEI